MIGKACERFANGARHGTARESPQRSHYVTVHLIGLVKHSLLSAMKRRSRYTGTTNLVHFMLQCALLSCTSSRRINMVKATLTLASRNYGSWSLRGWLLCKFAGLDFDVQPTASDDASVRAELLLLSPS